MTDIPHTLTLASLADLARRSKTALEDAIAHANDNGLSYRDIGEETGMHWEVCRNHAQRSRARRSVDPVD